MVIDNSTTIDNSDDDNDMILSHLPRMTMIDNKEEEEFVMILPRRIV